MTRTFTSVGGLREAGRRASKALASVSPVVLATMMFLTAADVGGRYLFNSPLKGAYEITQSMMVLLVFCALAYTASIKGHVAVDLVASRLSPRLRAVAGSITSFLSLAVFTIGAWQSVVQAGILFRGHLESGSLHIPTFPFLWVIAICFMVLSLVLLADFVDYLLRAVTE